MARVGLHHQNNIPVNLENTCRLPESFFKQSKVPSMNVFPQEILTKERVGIRDGAFFPRESWAGLVEMKQ